MGLAELFGVWVHCPMPPDSCTDEFIAVGVVGRQVWTNTLCHSFREV